MIMETKEWKMVYEKPTVNRQQVMLEQGIAAGSPVTVGLKSGEGVIQEEDWDSTTINGGDITYEI